MNVKELNWKCLSMLLCMMVAGLSFTACSDDDDKEDLDLASKVVGTYVGNGEMTYLDLLEVDSWYGMKVVVTRSSDEYVILELKEANGTSILTNTRAYRVFSTSSGYLLRDESAPSVNVMVDKSGTLTYENPNIAVDGESGYTISFSGRREKK